MPESGFPAHWGRVTHIHAPISKRTIIGSDNSLSPGRRQAIIWTNDGLLLIVYLLKKLVKFESKYENF